jgi:hypothetical protein
MSVAIPALLKIGTVVSTIGSVVSTVSGMKADSYNAGIAARNADLAERNKIAAIEASQREAEDAGVDARQEIGSLDALIGASGFDIGSGSNLLRRRSLRTLSQRDQSRIREDGNTEGEAFGQQAQDLRTESKMKKKSTKLNLFSGILGGASTYLGGASAIAKAREAYA